MVYQVGILNKDSTLSQVCNLWQVSTLSQCPPYIKYTCHCSGGDVSLEASVDTSDASLSDDAYKQVVSLLKLVHSSAARSADASALLKDELATVIQKGGLNRQVEVSLYRNELQILKYESASRIFSWNILQGVNILLTVDHSCLA